ncbi:MAG: lytic murein transglycosylase [Pseudomonadota bacterium]|nr:lytic murein transglycosylase [Pseudomonadota bacterium]
MRHNIQILRLLTVLPLALCWPARGAPALDQAIPADRPAPTPAGFQEFLQSLWPLAEEKTITRGTFDAAFAGLTPDPAAPTASNRQAEFDKPLKSYLGEAVSPRRVARGRECLNRWQDELQQIERRFGVPREILLAAFGIETDFGRAKGDKDVVRSLATLAYRRQDRPVFRNELIGALVMLDHGGVARAAMKGSWAGAMGGPQFLPSAYLKYAVSYTGQGSPDIWNNPLDSLASIANFLRQSGWQPSLSWGTEAILPKNFGFASLHGSFAAFAAQGVKSANGDAFPPAAEATLFLPSGAAGPAFLLSANYWILKAYNNSDSYALSLSLLAQWIEGKPAPRGHWPTAEIFLSRTQKAEIQRLLERLGLYYGPIDGRFGQASRDAIHDFQISMKAGPADGFATPELLDLLVAEVSGRPR